ncbi:MAG: hypothetical protein MK212_14010 [Saprospiraceae bacterium]|nr:hypothetical protein [Saprospiraceae bacterium]
MKQLINILFLAILLIACSSEGTESNQEKNTNLGQELKPLTPKEEAVAVQKDNRKEQKKGNEGRTELQKHTWPFGEEEVVDQFPSVDFEYATIYELNPSFREGAKSVFLGRTGKFKLLSLKEAKQVNKIISSSKSYGGSPAACFDPRIGLVYYNKDSIPVAHISICFDCYQSYAYPRIKGQEMHRNHGEMNGHGLSETGAVQLKYLFAEWGFPNISFNPTMSGEQTLNYLKDILPKVVGEEEAQKTIEDYTRLLVK